MLYAWVNGIKRRPEAKGERTLCTDCKGQITAVLPLQNVPHWRHLAGECDPWSEPEGEWHLWWKSQFEREECEITLIDPLTQEHHRADVLVTNGDQTTILELQHSSISEEERRAREAFYSNGRRMFWLLDMHDDKSFREFSFGMSLNYSRPTKVGSTEFFIMRWAGRGSQFIEKWKRSNVHVFLHWRRNVYYLATQCACRDLCQSLRKNEFALSILSEAEFFSAVKT
jgi:hypothetical protein